MKKTKEEEILLQIVENFKELGWDVMITVDESDVVPGVLAGTPTFVAEMRDALADAIGKYDQQQYRTTEESEKTEEAAEETTSNVTELRPTEKKKTFH